MPEPISGRVIRKSSSLRATVRIIKRHRLNTDHQDPPRQARCGYISAVHSREVPDRGHRELVDRDVTMHIRQEGTAFPVQPTDRFAVCSEKRHRYRDPRGAPEPFSAMDACAHRRSGDQPHAIQSDSGSACPSAGRGVNPASIDLGAVAPHRFPGD